MKNTSVSRIKSGTRYCVSHVSKGKDYGCGVCCYPSPSPIPILIPIPILVLIAIPIPTLCTNKHILSKHLLSSSPINPPTHPIHPIHPLTTIKLKTNSSTHLSLIQIQKSTHRRRGLSKVLRLDIHTYIHAPPQWYRAEDVLCCEILY